MRLRRAKHIQLSKIGHLEKQHARMRERADRIDSCGANDINGRERERENANVPCETALSGAKPWTWAKF